MRKIFLFFVQHFESFCTLITLVRVKPKYVYKKTGEKIMKKFIAIFFAVIVLTAAFVGCNPSTNDTSSTEDTSSVEDTSSAETVDPTTKLTTILADVKAAYADDAEYSEFLQYLGQLDVDLFADMYMVDKALIEVLVAEQSMMSANIDRFIGIKAVDGKGADVEAALKAFYENDKANLAWYPQNAAKTEAAKIIAHGDYVFYIILGNNPAVDAELSEADALAFAEEQIKKAVDVINAAF